jgi:zinc D-Ala-D-Ala dipeptidase
MSMKNFRLFIIYLFLTAFFISCDEIKNDPPVITSSIKEKLTDTFHIMNDSVVMKINDSTISPLEKKIIESGLVDINAVDSSIKVDLKYSTCDNFLFMDMYGDLDKAYLQRDVAEKLKAAQKYLQSEFPYYSLIIYDAVRPRSIQNRMWDTLKMPFSVRTKYVSNPQNGSLHNFGAAVDLSIIDENGVELDMGTPYDYFGELAYPREEERMIKEGKLSYKQLFNRQILRDAMTKQGFMEITTEWWHFNSCFRSQAILKYKIIE